MEKINLLRHNARCVVRELGLLNDAYFDIGVTLAERHLLIELSSCTCPTMGEIAARLLLDKSTASRLIAKAMQKGYIRTTLDAKDKRKRYLHLTDLGLETLNAFEPIAFHQTKEAMLALTEDEAELVHQGVALYAKGLKASRIQNRLPPEALPRETLQLPLGLWLTPFREQDEFALHDLFKTVVESDSGFVYESSSIQEFHRQFLAPGYRCYVCRSPEGEVIGGFSIAPSFTGRASHIANAKYMVKASHRGRGIGKQLVVASLEIAKQLGFEAMQFNLVLEQHEVARKLYDKLGFRIIGQIPSAVRNRDGTYQDGLIMFRELNKE